MRYLSLVVLLLAVPAHATIQRTFVSANGSDAALCTRTNPCRNFAAAITQTSPDGEVIVLDSAGYGAFAITKAITIAAPLGVHAALTVFAGDGITVTADASDVVILRNIYVNSLGGTNGVNVNQAKALHCERMVVNG